MHALYCEHDTGPRREIASAEGPGERNALGFLFATDPLVFLSVCQRTSSAAMLRCRPITEGGGALSGTAEEAESKGGSQASMTPSKVSSPRERGGVEEVERRGGGSLLIRPLTCVRRALPISSNTCRT